MIERYEIGPASDLAPGDRKVVTVDDGEICVLNHDGEYYAFENECCHDGGPVGEGRIRPEIEWHQSGPGEPFEESFGDRLTITCPWHGWTYYLASGAHAGDDDIALDTYDVVEEGSTLYLER